MEIIKITENMANEIGSLAAEFRVALKSFKGVSSKPNVAAGIEEIMEYLHSGFPVYAAKETDAYIGYMVCRVDAPCVWVESLFVVEAGRRQGIASLLLREAEKLSKSYGEETLYFYVHPNNHRMIHFLAKHGYTALNLIEIRKPYHKGDSTQKIQVGEHMFDY